MGSANELSPPINPVWRIILFPSSGQTLSVMKWPRVLPCSPVPSWPSNSACLRGKNGLQCGFNPTQPLLGFNGFPTSQLPPHLTHLHVTSSFSCSRCNFISRRAILQCLFYRSLCLLSFKQVFPLFSLHFILSSCSAKKKKMQQSSSNLSTSDDVIQAKHQAKTARNDMS